MKGHFDVNSQSKLIHSVEVTPANIHDSHVLPWLLHGEERRVWGDSAYAGQAGVLSACAPYVRDFTHRRSGRRATNRWKSRIRARVEHPIGVIKRVFGFTKVCYRGLAKNRHRLGRLRVGQPLHDAQAPAAPAGGVVSSDAERRPPGAPATHTTAVKCLGVESPGSWRP
jgi:IS5 family transposase